MTTSTAPQASAFGRQMKQWRRISGLSQLDLAVRAGLSQRHVSFIETGRSRPGEDVIHKVAEALDVPLRDRNLMLEAAGLTPTYQELQLSDEMAAPYGMVVQKMLDAHMPYPAFVINRWWEMVNANESGRKLFPMFGDGPVDLVETFLKPGPIREMVDNFPAASWTFLRRLRREVTLAGPDERLDDLLRRAEAYIEDIPPDIEKPGDDLVVCPNLKIDGRIIRTVSMVARFGTAREVTLAELRVELMYPMDDEADQFFKAMAEDA
ncbi:MAG: helix-turn-helix transcriptional regulator [Chloroflexi bacterium]|nr:helix-turn-helix transcriptional regulator [Chloroflexota bacterium]MBT4073714.1 helix-turn-helix transcriptional regulator [Chloroflexota bacterium]MBT4513677.1 helix-turn-helix transcriptional regulator [Chloroflexota bacterium]MBT5319575.1 helix-turn-helix transcriptional regulator [Chloroflexota bacterium]MBT6681245.1 helix-turn-helix transcriptional regulator [Chloroflexota bacterium]